MAKDDDQYRRGVGVMLLNKDGKVFVGRRIDNTDEAWQMPQGGIDKGEKAVGDRQARARGRDRHPPKLVERIANCPERLKYDLPGEIRHRLWGGKWKGQLQDWYLARFLGEDSDVNIATKHPEFNAWKWIDPEQASGPDRAVQTRSLPPAARRIPPVLLAELARLGREVAHAAADDRAEDWSDKR